jgi:transcriptional regulator with XRE-family HTH domain
MAPHTYGEILARNIRAARSRADIGQESVAARMRALGHDAWIRQTVGSTERGRRRPTAEEIFTLALCLQTSISALLAPTKDDKGVDVPGQTLSVESVQALATGFNDGAVTWDRDTPVFAPGERAWWGDRPGIGRDVREVLDKSREAGD